MNNKLTKLEKIYNCILFITTIITLVLFAKPIIVMIRYTINTIFGNNISNLSIGGLAELATLGMFFIPVMIGIILVSLAIYVLLLIMTFITRKIHTRKIRWLEILYLILISFILSISIGFYNKGSIMAYIDLYTLYGVYISLILLIVILVKNRKEKD